MQTMSKSAKAQYTETEAAAELGVSVERLRSLIRDHIGIKDEEMAQTPVVTFQPSDVLLLKLLSAQVSAQAPQG